MVKDLMQFLFLSLLFVAPSLAMDDERNSGYAPVQLAELSDDEDSGQIQSERIFLSDQGNDEEDKVSGIKCRMLGWAAGLLRSFAPSNDVPKKLFFREGLQFLKIALYWY